jgi:hypothetical protein
MTSQALPRDEAIGLSMQADRAWDVVLDEYAHDRPNSVRARLALLEARHCREQAAVHASLAVAAELDEVRRLLMSRVVGL